MKNRFENKVAIITGGGGNIGGYAAELLASEGCAVAICDFDLKKAETVAEKIVKAGGRAIALQADVRHLSEAEKTVGKVIDELSKVDILVCGAGGSTREKMKYFCDQEEAVYVNNIAVNLFGALNFVHAVCPNMIGNRSGKIIFITSIVAMQGRRGHVEYSAAKGGLLSAAKSLAMELGEFNINVNCVSPSQVVLPGIEIDLSDIAYLRRNETPMDIANAIAFMVSDEASFVTGQNLPVDGGHGLGVQHHTLPGRDGRMGMAELFPEKYELLKPQKYHEKHK